MSKRTAVAVGATGVASGLAGYILARLRPIDVKSLADKILDGAFAFLHEQGAYASFALVMALAFGGLSVWSIRLLITGKQGEINRIAEERDKLQKLFIDDWKSSRGGGGRR